MSPGFWRIGGGRIVAPAPAQEARALVDPIIAADHLGDPRKPKAEQAQSQADRVVDEIIVQGQELAVEQGEVEEAHAEAQDHHVERDVPPRPPGRRDRAACEPGSAAAEQYAYQQKYAERLLIGHEFGD